MREFLISTKVAYFLIYIKWEGNLYQSYLKLHHQKVKLKCLLLSAKELGFSEHGVGKAFHEKRNRIGEYELEWLEPELDFHPGAAKRIERLKKTFTQIVCTYCGRQLTCKERVKNGFGMYKLNEKTGHLMEEHEVNSIYEGNKITGLSVSSLKNAADKGNAIITRRKDKQRFILCWQSIHERCFQIRKEERWLEMRRKIREDAERKKEA